MSNLLDALSDGTRATRRRGYLEGFKLAARAVRESSTSQCLTTSELDVTARDVDLTVPRRAPWSLLFGSENEPSRELDPPRTVVESVLRDHEAVVRTPRVGDEVRPAAHVKGVLGFRSELEEYAL